MFNYKRTNNSIEIIAEIIRNMTDEDFEKLIKDIKEGKWQ